MDPKKLKSEIRKSVASIVKNKYITGTVMLRFPEPDGNSRKEILELADKYWKRVAIVS